MQVLDYVRILRRRWWLALLPLLLIAVVTVATTPAAAPVTYAVTVRFAGGLPPEPARESVYNYDRHYNWLASEYITRALAQAVETGEFAKNLSTRLAGQGIVVPVGAIRSEYLASYMKVTVSWPDDSGAVVITRALVDEISQNAANYWPQLSGVDAAPVRLLDEPVAVPVAPPLRSRFDLPVRALLGIAAGLLLAFAVHYLDPYVREPRELERFDMRVIGEIP